jgi:2-hydroxycyclohexanecarboxyl-CoA dehydrogenase
VSASTGLAGRTALITGGGTGIGAAIAGQLTGAGARVVLVGRRREPLEAACERLGNARAEVCDVADAESVSALAYRTENEEVSILVNNAALSPFCKFEEITEQVWDDLMALNLKGPFLCCQAVVPDMLEAGWGRIINISSSSAQTGSARQTHYAASKAGVIGFTKSLAQEFATSGITVNNVPPGFVNTEGMHESPVDVEAFAPTTPMKRAGRPENIAAAVAFLASEDADYITGHTLSVNGGRYSN